MELSGSVTRGAEAKIGETLQSYGNDLAKTLRAVEKAGRSTRAKEAEFTTSTVIKADDELRRSTRRWRRSRWDLVLGIAAPVASGVVGVFSNYLHSTWQTGTFGAAAAIAFISTVMLVARTASNR